MVIDKLDFTLPEPKMRRLNTGGLWRHLRVPFWADYFEEAVHGIFRKGGWVVDIGGGLRIDATRGDKANPSSQKKFSQYLSDPTVKYSVTDYTDQYHPDFVEDIHKLSFADGSIDATICLAVLEHVYDPKLAVEELVRVTKKGGEIFVYVPFIYRYHANVTSDYKDYYRYSKDGIAYLFRDCASVELCPVRGLFESLLRFTPLHTIGLFASLLRLLDWSGKRMRQISERQASGYFVRAVR